MPVFACETEILALLHSSLYSVRLTIAKLTPNCSAVSRCLRAAVAGVAPRRLSAPVWFTIRKRSPWAQVNLFVASPAAAVVGLSEDSIARFTALEVLLPVVAGQSGNTGSQALAVVIRSLALREVNGIGVAATTRLGVYLSSGWLGLTLVIATSMIASLAIAGLAGAGVPMLLTLLRLDPAQPSSIVFISITDVAGFFSFLSIATLLADLLPSV